MSTNYAIALMIASVACATDLRTRRIPNVLTFGGAAAALVFHLFAQGGQGFFSAGTGWLVGVAVFFLPFALGGLGAGDIKLMAALGAWLGPQDIVWTAVYTALAGGVLAIVIATASGYLRQALSNVWMLLCHWSVAGLRPLHELSLEGSKGPRMAYALPILVGVMCAVWLR